MTDRNTRLKKTTRNLFFWTSLWLMTLALATFGKIVMWESSSVLSVFAVALNISVGIAMLVANARHLSCLDELQTKMQMNAMALTLGIGLIVSVSLSALNDWGIVKESFNVGFLMVFMSLSYLACLVNEYRRYK